MPVRRRIRPDAFVKGDRAELADPADKYVFPETGPHPPGQLLRRTHVCTCGNHIPHADIGGKPVDLGYEPYHVHQVTEVAVRYVDKDAHPVEFLFRDVARQRALLHR